MNLIAVLFLAGTLTTGVMLATWFVWAVLNVFASWRLRTIRRRYERAAARVRAEHIARVSK